MAEVVVVFEIAGALVGTLKGIYALYTVIKAYTKSEYQMRRFMLEVKSLEGQLHGLRATRIRLRQKGGSSDLLLSVMMSEQRAWQTLVDIDNDVLCSLQKNRKHWKKVSRKQKARWVASVNEEAEKYNGRLLTCSTALETSNFFTIVQEYARERYDQPEARIHVRDKAAEAMEEALVQRLLASARQDGPASPCTSI